ncbi:hypothetical protein AGMMS49938_05360 [Fibrobacterales bacterium]|nr:hypothetical protein AGMMS49938_05360 [Fibrobacterales bacterium]
MQYKNTVYPNEKTLKLSDAFEIQGKETALELVVKIFNINKKGHNPSIEQNSQTLNGYSTFIDKVREFEKEDTLENAVRKAVSYCIENGILRDYLERNKSEVINMLFTEFNMDDALAVREEGFERGISQGLQKGLQALLDVRLSMSEAKKKLGLP